MSTIGIRTLVIGALLTLPLALGIAGSGHAQDGGAPTARFAENEVDQGVLLQGEVVERQVVIHNDGTVPLVIGRADPSCGCTTVVSFPREIEPGGQGLLKFEINSKKIKPGEGRKRIRLLTNDPIPENGDYYFTVTVVALYRSDPMNIKMTGLHDREKRTTVRLRGTTEYGFDLEEASAREGLFTIEEFYILEEGSYELVLSAPPVAAPGKSRDPLDLIIQTEDGRVVRVGQWVEIENWDPVQVFPERVVQFGNRETDPLLAEGAPPAVQSVMLRARAPEANFSVLSARLEGVPDGAFEVKVVPVIEGSQYRVDVSLPRYRVETYLVGQLIIETDATVEPTRTLTVRAKFGRKQ
jgi:hypothetical protein